MRLIGYARVSSIDQNLDRQLGALVAARCDRIFQEKMSGRDIKNRPQLAKAIASLGTGDTLVVAEWDRATRSMMDGLHIMQEIIDRGALVKVLDRPALDLTTPMGRGFLAFLSSMAEEERKRILVRAQAGREAAKKRGVHMGRPPKLTSRELAVIQSRKAAGESSRSIAHDYRVSHSTIVRA